MRLILAAAALMAAVFATPAAAQSCDTGCNVVDDGSFGYNIIGRTLYYDMLFGANAPMRVSDVNFNSGIVYGTLPSGRMVRVSAYDLYTGSRVAERDLLGWFLCRRARRAALPRVPQRYDLHKRRPRTGGCQTTNMRFADTGNRVRWCDD